MGVDPMVVSTRTISALADGSTTQELDELSIRTAAGLIVEEPNYSKLAARMLATYVDKEVRNQNVPWFSESVTLGHTLGLIGDDVLEFVTTHAPELNAAINSQRDKNFEFFGLRTVYDRYLLRHPETRKVIETPQYFFLRVACGLSTDADEAIKFYDLMSSLAYLPSSPTLFNSGTTHPQMSSCYLLDSPVDELDAIYGRYTDIAQLSKYSGGIGVAYHRVRARGSLIKGTNGHSNGIVPWLNTLDSSVAAVNQGGRRKGACCVYLETWHADIEEFLELRENTGDIARRTHNLNLANWVPDLFMKRVEKIGSGVSSIPSGSSSSSTPSARSSAPSTSRPRPMAASKAGSGPSALPAHDEDAGRDGQRLDDLQGSQQRKVQPDRSRCRRRGQRPHRRAPVEPVHEILGHLAVETAVCNLGSVNLGEFSSKPTASPATTSARRVRSPGRAFLDRVIDINYYPTDEAGVSNARWRPVGLGRWAWDVFFKLGVPFDSLVARDVSRRIPRDLPTPCGPPPNWPRPTVPTLPSSRPVPPTATCNWICGASTSPTPSVGNRCVRASRPTVCATRS